jgi:hypothetical protein
MTDSNAPEQVTIQARASARLARLDEIRAAERARIPAWTAGMTGRARWARDHNGGEPDPAWSTGEQLIVGLILGNDRYLADAGCTREEVRCRLAGDLYGGDPDAWLSGVRVAL